MANVTPATEESIKLWLKVGNLKKLEQAVLDGYSDQLRGRNSRIPKINKFLKRVPHYQAKIASIHTTSATGNLRELENLLDRKGLVLGRDGRGATPLHTAVHHKQPDVIKYIIDAYPPSVLARDHHGRTPLHYAALAGDQQIFDLLVESGADKDAKDSMGNTVNDYSKSPEEFQLARAGSSRWLNKGTYREMTSQLRQPSPISPMTKSEIRAMIQRGDVAKLEKVILQGYGESLVGETAISTRVRDLLDSVPLHLNKLRAIDSAIESGSTRKVQNLVNRKGLVLARDSQGLTVFHKAVIHGQKDIVQYLMTECPKAIFAKDHDKRTPVHYAAVQQDDGEIYKLLTEAGGNTSLPDCDGKTPEYYRLNPGSLNLAKLSERESAGSGKLSHSTSNGGLSKTTTTMSTKSGKRDQSSGISESTSLVKQWLRSGDIEKLEKAVVDGHGLKIIRETTSDPRGRAFLRTVPVYMTKIGMIHEAVSQGSLRNLKVLLDRKKLAMSRDQLGLGLLHKALLYGHPDIVQYLLETYPETVNVKDKVGRTALHYAAVVKDKETLYPQLLEAGADATKADTKGNTAEHYYANVDEMDISEILNRVNRQRNRANNAGHHLNATATRSQEPATFTINGANIRKWIHSEDIAKLEQVVLEGQGYKLILETSNNARVKQFLVSVPSIVNKIREIHNSVVTADLQGVESAVERPNLLLSKDEFGMTPLHKSVLLEQDEITRFISGTNPATLHVKDGEGRTALHYAAALKDSGKTYEELCRAGADPTAVDIRGKSADHYVTHPGELDMRQLMAHVNRCKPSASVKQHDVSGTPAIKRPAPPSNLRPVHKAGTGGVTSEAITKAVQLGDLDKLDQLVLDGQGKRLLGKSSWNEDVRNFLKKVPHCMDKIYAIHMASASGDLILLQQLLDRKKFVLSRDEYGHTALHKAVKYGQLDVVKYLLQTVPSSHAIRDQDGRTPLHYAAMYKDRGAIYDLLVANGAQTKVQDNRGKSPEYYYASLTKLESPIPPKPLDRIGRGGSEERDSGSGSTDSSPDEEKQMADWIESGNLRELENLVIDGQGERLLGKTSDSAVTRDFLEAVPALMGKIRAVHNAAANGDVKDLQSGDALLALSRDEHGACPLHKAVLYGHHNAMKFLATNYPASLKIQDNGGLTALHYAALVSSDGYFYRLLHNFGADPNVKDRHGFTPGQILRGNGPTTGEELFKRYEEKRVPPRPHSVQTWERPPTEEILRALTPSPMNFGERSHRSDRTVSDIDKDSIDDVAQSEEEGTKTTAMLVKNEDDALVLVEEIDGKATVFENEEGDGRTTTNISANDPGEKNEEILGDAIDENEKKLEIEIDENEKISESEMDKNEKILEAEMDENDEQISDEARKNLISEGDASNFTDTDILTSTAADNLTSTAAFETYDEIPIDSESLPEAEGTESEVDLTESDVKLHPRSPDRKSPEGAEQLKENGDGDNDEENASFRKEKPNEDSLQMAALTASGDGESMVSIDDKESISDARIGDAGDTIFEEDEDEDNQNINKAETVHETDNIDNIDVNDGVVKIDGIYKPGSKINNDELTNLDGENVVDTQKNDAIELDADNLVDIDEDRMVDIDKDRMVDIDKDRMVDIDNMLDISDQVDGTERIKSIDTIDSLDGINNTEKQNVIEQLQNIDDAIDSNKYGGTIASAENKKIVDTVVDGNNDIDNSLRKNIGETETRTTPITNDENHVSGKHDETEGLEDTETGEPETMRAEALVRQLSEEDSDQVVVGQPQQDTDSVAGVSMSSTTAISADGEESPEDEFESDGPKSVEPEVNATRAPPELGGRIVSPLDILAEDTNNNGTTAVTTNTTFDLFRNASPESAAGNPLHWTKEGEYLTAVLGDALITALAEVSRTRPDDPVAYLALLLYRYIHKTAASASSKTGNDEITKTDNVQQAKERQNGVSQMSPRSRLLSDDGGSIDLEELSKIKASDGSNIVHFAATLQHDDPDSFLELLRQSNYNLAERDSRFRTARDVAREMGVDENADAVDRYVFSSVRSAPDGELAAQFVERLVLDGYDHLLDITDDEGNDVIMVAELTQNAEAAKLLKGARAFQDQVELLHEHIRNGNREAIVELLESDPKLGAAKNAKGQTAMHLAVLCEDETIVETVTKSTSAVVNEQDNMGRTPLHYAMGTTNPQVLAKIIVKQGGNQFSRDATSHMPSFYFINNTEIQKLKDELEEITI